jgi:hypothetical protein
MSIEAMKLALEAWDTGLDKRPAMEALRTAIAEAEKQEPVAWMDEFGNVFPLGAQRGPKYLNEPMKPLYTTPPAQPAQRQPLTEEEIMQTWEGVIKYAPGEVRLKDFARAIEAAHGITGEKT